MEDRRSMTTFYYCSVNQQSGLQRNTSSKLSYNSLIYQNVLQIIYFHLKYMMVSYVKRFWCDKGRKVGHLAQIQPKCQFLFHKNLPPRDFSILTLVLYYNSPKTYWKVSKYFFLYFNFQHIAYRNFWILKFLLTNCINADFDPIVRSINIGFRFFTFWLDSWVANVV